MAPLSVRVIMKCSDNSDADHSDVKLTNFGVPELRRLDPSHMRMVESSVAAYKWC